MVRSWAHPPTGRGAPRISQDGRRPARNGIPHGEGSPSQAAWNVLRKRVNAETVAGVDAVNIVTGGKATYRAMRYTPGAVEFLRHRSHTWQTSTSDRIRYRPRGP